MSTDNKLIQEQPILMTFNIIIQYIISDIQKKPRSFKIGLFTIYLVVTFLTFLQSAFQLSPLILLQLSEKVVGDIDVIISPINETIQYQYGYNKSDPDTDNSQFLKKLINSTQVENAIREMKEVYGHSPRWLLLGDLMRAKDFTGGVSVNEKLRTFVLIIDAANEVSVGIGRTADVDPLENNQVYVTASTLRGLGISEGQDADLNIDLSGILEMVIVFDKNCKEKDCIAKQITDRINQEFSNKFGDDLLHQEINTTQLMAIFKILSKITGNQQNMLKFLMLTQNYSKVQQQSLMKLIKQSKQQDLKKNFQKLNEVVKILPQNQSFSLMDISMSLAEYIQASLNITLHLKVKQSISKAHGKWTDGLGNVVAIDYRNFTPIIVGAFSEALEGQSHNETNVSSMLAYKLIPRFIDYLVGYQITNAMTSNLVLNDRINIYASPDSIQNSLIKTSNLFYERIGKAHPSKMMSPLADCVKQFFLIKNFLDTLVFSTTFILFGLSVLLIYALMVGDVNEKTYDFGMLRALGFRKLQVVFLLVLQSLLFAVPAIVLGMISAYLLNSLLAMIIFSETQIVSSYQLDYTAIILGICIGLIVPLVSNIIPIQKALSVCLRVIIQHYIINQDSINQYNRKIDYVVIYTIRLETMGISLTQTLIALMMIFMGFVSYYLTPLSFIFENMSVFLILTNLQLIILIIGLTLIANLLQNPIQKALVSVILKILKRDRILKPIILKNMQGHSRRNSLTALIYTLTLSLLIFTGTGFLQQGRVTSDTMVAKMGANIVIMAGALQGLDEQQLTQYMKSQQDPTLLKAYSFVTFPIQTKISPLSSFPNALTSIVGVEENLLSSVQIEFYIPNAYDSSVSFPILSNGLKDAVYGLYSRDGNQDLNKDGDVYNIQSNAEERSGASLITYTDDREINIILPQTFQNDLSMNVDTLAMLDLGGVLFRAKVRHMATRIPGFLISGYRQQQSECLVSMVDYKYIVEKLQKEILSLSNSGQFQNKKKAIKVSVYDLKNIKSLFLMDQQDQRSKSKSNTQNNPIQPLEGLSYQLRKQKLFIKFARSTSEIERIDFINGLRNTFLDDQTFVYDVLSMEESNKSQYQLLQMFFAIVAIITIILSYFLILLSFTSNVNDKSWEFGILRSIGLDKGQLTRIFIYEALALILTSGLIGSVVGISVALAITVQMVTFIELPLVFLFPTEIFFITFIEGILMAIIASYCAASKIKDKSISDIIKGIN